MKEGKPGDVRKGSIFDTEIYKDLPDEYKTSGPDLTDEDMDRINAELSVPDARPGKFDGTLESWLLRISLWGRLKFTHKNPDNGINKTITKDQFLDYVDDQTRNASYGLWIAEELEINKIRLYRKFMSIRGREITEELIVDIDLRPDLKKKINQARRGSPWF